MKAFVSKLAKGAKPCPFCGGPGWEERNRPGDKKQFWIACGGCGTSGPWNKCHMKGALEDWNRRIALAVAPKIETEDAAPKGQIFRQTLTRRQCRVEVPFTPRGISIAVTDDRVVRAAAPDERGRNVRLRHVLQLRGGESIALDNWAVRVFYVYGPAKVIAWQ